ncbi:MAG: hypothetical protein OXT67_05410 [Zetaproteobacteria bacterium]|nr:hypothetical protein [Zetaproteobacteria bacterium]
METTRLSSQIFLNLQKYCITILVFLSLVGCGAEPDYEFASGNCALSCENAIVGGSDMRIRILSPQSGFVTQCGNTGGGDPDDHPSEIPVKFVIEKPRKALPAEGASSTGQGSGINADEGNAKPEAEATAEGEGASTEPIVWEPVAGISFQPMYYGGVVGDQTRNSENPDDPLYKGILTSQANWCTDTCGVGSVRIKPRCFSESENTVSVGIFSGNIFNSTTFTVKQPM